MDQLLHHLLDRSARDHPEDVAVSDGMRTASYGDLDLRSNQLANLLIHRGTRRGDRVGLYLDKSIESLVAIYGILKAGAAYVPLDPKAPTARLAFIARDCGITTLVTSAEKRPDWAKLISQGAPIDTFLVLNEAHGDGIGDDVSGAQICSAAALEEQPSTRPSVEAIDMDLAFILYTSGSTGEPKGVKLSHLNAMTFVNWAAELCSVGRHDRLSSHAPLHFDLSVFDLFAAAKGGARVVLVPTEALLFPSQTVRFISKEQITIWYSVPTALSMMVQRGGLSDGDCPRLRIVLFAGEVFPTKYLRRSMELLAHADFFNLYGPTETNVCTYYHVPSLVPDMVESIPIGVPIGNVEVFAVTEDGRPAGVGEIGELYVRGAGVMQGYWGDPARTDATLVPHPFLPEARDPVYRTGDLVSLDPDGNYRLLGRRDSQIKSRGYRIELGEVEVALYAHPSVVECAVVAVPDELITNRIRAYVVTRNGVGADDLTRFCAERIPHYMIPDVFEFVSELPKTSTGKVDRRVLSAG